MLELRSIGVRRTVECLLRGILCCLLTLRSLPLPASSERVATSPTRRANAEVSPTIVHMGDRDIEPPLFMMITQRTQGTAYRVTRVHVRPCNAQRGCVHLSCHSLQRSRSAGNYT